MILASDRITLAPGVTLTDAGVCDELRSEPIALNASARAVVCATSAEDAAVLLADTFDIGVAQARDDALAFVRDLNRRLLVNVTPQRGVAAYVARGARALALSLPLGELPALAARRHRVDTSSATRLVAGGARATIGPACALGGVAGVVALLAAPIGDGRGVDAAVLGATVAVSIVVHEVGHLVWLRGVPAAVVVLGLRVSVVHRAVTRPRQRVVACGGAAAAVALASAAAAIASVAPSAAAATVIAVFGVQAVGFTVLTADGRRACGLS